MFAESIISIICAQTLHLELLEDNYRYRVSLKVELCSQSAKNTSDSHISFAAPSRTVNYNYIAFQVSVWLSNTFILLQLTSSGFWDTGINSPKWSSGLLAVSELFHLFFVSALFAGLWL